uniref:AY112355 n=1 Tax=Arundo donax TaxID=35708 RepID=A0A0A9HSP2_ARUDO
MARAWYRNSTQHLMHLYTKTYFVTEKEMHSNAEDPFACITSRLSVYTMLVQSSSLPAYGRTVLTSFLSTPKDSKPQSLT